MKDRNSLLRNEKLQYLARPVQIPADQWIHSGPKLIQDVTELSRGDGMSDEINMFENHVGSGAAR